MKRRRLPDLVVGFLIGFASLLVIFLLSSDMAAHYEICETTKEGAKECARYNVVALALHEVWVAIDIFNGAVTAIATAFIAWFTLSLRQATDRLWDAGERQLKFLSDSAAAQARDMQASVAVAERAAQAAEKSAQAAISSKLPSIQIGRIRLFHPGPPYGQLGTAFENEVFL